MKKLKTKAAVYLEKYKIRILFEDGKIQVIDFKGFLKSSSHPAISKYLDVELFENFTIKNGDLMWGDFDLVFPVHDLYTNSIRRKANKSSAAS